MPFFQPSHARTKVPAMSPSRRRKLIFSYAPDWYAMIIMYRFSVVHEAHSLLQDSNNCAGVRPPYFYPTSSPAHFNSALFYSLNKVNGYRRVFSLEDTSYVPASQLTWLIIKSTYQTTPSVRSTRSSTQYFFITSVLSSYAVHERVPVGSLVVLHISS